MKYGTALLAVFTIAGLNLAQATEPAQESTPSAPPATEAPATPPAEAPAAEAPAAPVQNFTLVKMGPSAACPALKEILTDVATKVASDPTGAFKNTVSKTIGGTAMSIIPTDGSGSFSVAEKAAIIDSGTNKYMVVLKPGVAIKAVIDTVTGQTPPTITSMNVSGACEYKVNGQTMIYVGQVTQQ